jgi:predicted DNA-binding transcriptional regulator AlpA
VSDLLNRAAVARLLAVSARTLERWGREGRGPRPLRVGPRLVRYRRDDARFDGLLARFARRGGCVVQDEALVEEPQS